MDLNELFSRHQIALIRAASTAESREQRRFAAQAGRYRARIDALQQNLRTQAAHGQVGAL